MAACSSFQDEESMEIQDTGSLEMEVDLPPPELQRCRNAVSVSMPTASQQEFLGLPFEPSRINYSDFLYLVLDTNVLISHLKFLMELKDQSIKGIGKPVLVVPWTVVQELDSLKSSDKNISRQASKAGVFINDCLSAKHPRVRGQTVEEVNTELQNLAIVNNDDRILHCCLVYQYKIRTRGEHGVVILFSNDTLLCAKGKMNNITSCDRKNLMSQLKTMSESCTRAPPVSYTHTKEYESKLNKQLANDEKSQLIDDCLCQAEVYTRDAFTILIHYEMNKVYGDLRLVVYTRDAFTILIHYEMNKVYGVLSHNIMYRKPPWTLEDVMVLLNKHWVAVFRYVFTIQTYSCQERVKSLLTHVKTRSRLNPSPSLVVQFINNTLQLLEQLRTNTVVWSKINVLVASLKVLKEKADRPRLSPSLPQSPPVTPTNTNIPTRTSTPPNIMPINSVAYGNPTESSFLPLLSDGLYQVLNQIPLLPIAKLRWMFIVIQESLRCGIISAQTSLTRQSQMWMLDLLQFLEQLLMALENVLTQGLLIAPLRVLYDAIDIYLNNVLSIPSPVTFNIFCEICQLMQETVLIFQDGLSFLLESRLQLLQLLQQAARNQITSVN